MTVQLTRTKAEQALLQSFEAALPTLPGTGWVADLRREAIGIFAARGLPHRRIEEWKYTDLRERLKDTAPPAAFAPVTITKADLERALGPLAAIDALRVVFVDGRFESGLSEMPDAASGLEVFPLEGMLGKAPAWLAGKFAADRIERDDPVAALNLAFMRDGLMLKAKAGAGAGRPVMLVSLAASASAVSSHEHHIVSVEAGAALTLIEVRAALGGVAAQQTTSLTSVDVANGGTLHHVRCTSGGDAVALTQWRVRIAEAATYRGFQLTAGAALARNDIRVGFTGADAKLDLSGAFLGRGADHIDTTLVVDHATPGCESRELFKGVLDGRARGVFQGKIIVQPIAQKTDGKQMSQALMLSEDAEFDSKPELEIYADDVACGHGATAAELDADMLFYLMSRGIPRAEARAMLIESFVGEAIDKVDDEAVREAVMQVARTWLGAAPSNEIRGAGRT